MSDVLSEEDRGAAERGAPGPAAPRGARPTPAAYALLLLASVLPGLAFTALMPVLPAIEAHFGETPGAAPLVRGFISALSVAMIVGPVLASAMADRFGLRRVLLSALALYGLAGTAGFFLNDLMAILASRALVGLASAATMTLSLSYLATHAEPAEREKWMGWLAAAGIAGTVVVAPLAGAIGGLGWRYVFLLHLLAAPLAGLAAVAIRSDRVSPDAPALSEAAPRSSSPLPASVWALMILAAGAGAVTNVVPMFLPFHLAEIGEGRPSRIAVAMMTTTLAGTISVVYGVVRRWLSMPLIFAVGLATGGGGLLLIGAAQDYPLVLAGLLAAGLGLGMAMPNMNALAAAIAPPAQSGRVIGFVIASFSLGAPLAQFCLELMAKGEPARTPILWLGGLSLGLSLVWLTAGQAIRPRAQEARRA